MKITRNETQIKKSRRGREKKFTLKREKDFVRASVTSARKVGKQSKKWENYAEPYWKVWEREVKKLCIGRILFFRVIPLPMEEKTWKKLLSSKLKCTLWMQANHRITSYLIIGYNIVNRSPRFRVYAFELALNYRYYFFKMKQKCLQKKNNEKPKSDASGRKKATFKMQLKSTNRSSTLFAYSYFHYMWP